MQCVIFATRPLLLSVMKERLDILGHPGDENWESFLGQTRAVISTGIKSAAKTLQIVTSEDGLLRKSSASWSLLKFEWMLIKRLESFLLYDLEFTFEAALHLTMANALFPGVVDYERCRELAHQVLDELIARGNRVAGARSSELHHLEGLCQELVAKIHQQGHQTLRLFAENAVGGPDLARGGTMVQQRDGLPTQGGELHGTAIHTEPWQHFPCLTPAPPMPSDTEFLDSIGISSEEFLYIVQHMGDPGTLPESMLTLG